MTRFLFFFALTLGAAGALRGCDPPLLGAALLLALVAGALVFRRAIRGTPYTKYDKWHEHTMLEVLQMEHRATDDWHCKRITWNEYVRQLRRADKIAIGLMDYRSLYSDLKADGTIEEPGAKQGRMTRRREERERV